ncbi:MAG: hypothetical protein ACLRSD_09725 [Oscillibacter sp.]
MTRHRSIVKKPDVTFPCLSERSAPAKMRQPMAQTMASTARRRRRADHRISGVRLRQDGKCSSTAMTHSKSVKIPAPRRAFVAPESCAR